MPNTDAQIQPSPAAPQPPSKMGLEALNEEARREYWATLALRCTNGLGLRGICSLLKHFGSAWEAVQNHSQWQMAGVGHEAVTSYLSEAWRKTARPEWDAAKELKGHIILWTDPNYPYCLRELDDAPALLYAVGDLSLLRVPRVAIVGSRKCSQAAMDFASAIAEGLSAAGVTVVSGMALGLDGRAHRSALRGPGQTIAVLANGADVPYPAQHAELYHKIAAQGLIISELPPGTTPGPGAFPVRNRIVSGLSLGVLMVEADSQKSGSLITARLAAEQGRNVYVPAPDAIKGEYREGTRYLLESGASPIWQAEDILADLFPHLKRTFAQSEKRKHLLRKPAEEKGGKSTVPASDTVSAPPTQISTSSGQSPASCPPLSPDESFLLDLLRKETLSSDDLLLKAQELDAAWSAPRLLAALMMLEVKKAVRRLSDSRYEVRT